MKSAAKFRGDRYFSIHLLLKSELPAKDWAGGGCMCLLYYNWDLVVVVALFKCTGFVGVSNECSRRMNNRPGHFLEFNSAYLDCFIILC